MSIRRSIHDRRFYGVLEECGNLMESARLDEEFIDPSLWMKSDPLDPGGLTPEQKRLERKATKHFNDMGADVETRHYEPREPRGSGENDGVYMGLTITVDDKSPFWKGKPVEEWPVVAAFFEWMKSIGAEGIITNSIEDIGREIELWTEMLLPRNVSLAEERRPRRRGRPRRPDLRGILD